MKTQCTPLDPGLYRYLLIFVVIAMLPLFFDTVFAGNPSIVTCPSECQCEDGIEVGDCENPTYINLTASDLDGLPNNTLTGGCVNIYGKLIVNVNFTFDGCEIIMDPGAEIEVQGGRKLTIKNQTTLHGCEYMWRGITVTAYAKLDMENSTILDAQYAVQAQNNAYLRLDGNTFDANYVGVYVPPINGANQIHFIKVNNSIYPSIKDNKFLNESTYLPPYSGQSPDPGIIPYAGFLINDGNLFNIGNPNNGSVENNFDGILNGIIDIDGNGNSYSGCQMANIDAGLPNGVGVKILGATGRIKVKYCFMDQVRVGVQAVKYRLLDIFSNTINVVTSDPFNVYDAGISLSSGTRNALVESNTIDGPICILLSNSNNGSYPVDIESNELTTTGFGIYTWLVNGELNVTGNTIDMNYPEPDPCPTYGVFGILGMENTGPTTIIGNSLDFSGFEQTCGTGILVLDCKNGQIVENTILGNSADFFESSPGIYIGNSPNYLYCCNTVDSTSIGVGFEGMSNDTKLSNTTFGDHSEALYLAYAEISPQIHTGNDWRQATTTWDAVFFGNYLAIPLSKFTTDPDLIPNGYNQIYVPTGAAPQEWFLIIGDTDNDTGVPTCEQWEYEGTYCGDDPYYLVENPNEFTELTDADLEALNPPPGNDTIALVLKWEQQGYLYGKLTNNPDLVEWNTSVDSFYTDAQSGLVGEFHAVETSIQGLFFPPDSLSSGYDEMLEDLDTLQSELGEIGQQLLATEDEEEIDSLVALMDSLVTDEINPLIEDLEDIVAAISSWRGDRISEVQAGNASISPLTPYQEYAQVVFDIYLSTVAKEEEALTQQQQDTLEAIANKCPLIDGTGVYWARAILRYYYGDQTWALDECGVLDERSVKTGKNKQVPEEGQIFPNPSNGTLVLQLATPLAMEGTLSVFNLDGKRLVSEKLAAGSVGKIIDLTGLPAGIYFCEIREGGSTVLCSRIVVAR